MLEIKKNGRPKKYKTIEEAKEAKRINTLISNKRRYEEKKKQKQEIEGGKIKINLSKSLKKIGKDIKQGFNKNIAQPIASVAEKIKKDVTDYGKAVIYGRDDYPPKVRNILEKIGDKNVKSIIIKRTPVPELLTGALSLFSFGKFGERLEKSFDELFHLFIEMTLEDNTRVSLEKNEVINMDINPKNRPNTESKLINTNIHNININKMLENTEKYMTRKKFFSYSAMDNNCQDFILSFLKANNIGDNIDYVIQ
jgi:hypothetical protein